MNEKESRIEVCYCYWKPFHKLPNRKWKKFSNEKDAQAFIEKIERHPRRFVWCVLKHGKEVYYDE